MTWDKIWPLLWQGTKDTLLMTIPSTLFAYLLGIPLGLCYMLMIAPFSAPDEHAHYLAILAHVCPLINGGMSRVRAVAATAACGLPTVLGAWLGYWLGDIGPLGLSLSLGFASGAMLYVVFGEIIPQSVLMYRSKLPTFFVIVGILLGLLIIYY